jgi:hypothetical protein
MKREASVISSPTYLDGAEIARYRSLGVWTPKVGDFIIWHGFFKRWYGIIHDVSGDRLMIIREHLPKLLFSLPSSEYKTNSIELSSGIIRSSRGGEYAILQDGAWYIDE